jgi:hypothetical protein
MKVAITNSLLKHQCIRGWSITNRKKQQKEQKEKERKKKRKEQNRNTKRKREQLVRPSLIRTKSNLHNR